MLTESVLRELLHRPGLGKTDKLLLCLAVESRPKSVREVTTLAIKAGLRGVKAWNVSSLLSRSGGRAIRTHEGWELRSSGRQHVAQIAGPLSSSLEPELAATLRSHLPKLNDPQVSAFVREAIECYEQKLFRAAVVLSWVGALSVLYQEVIAHHLSAFNAEALRRNPKWKLASKPDDLSRMKEKDFLDTLEHLSVIGKNVKQELGTCLTLRNGCGHPNSLVIAEHRVSSHIEILLLNVFAVYNP